MEADLRTYLVAQTDISAAVSSRIYLLVAPQTATRPLVIFRLVQSDGLDTLNDTTGLVRTDLEIECQATTDIGAKSLKELIRRRLHTYRGTMGGTFICSCLHTSESDDYIPPQTASDTGIYVASIGFDVIHTRSVPLV
ncbi:DUF3168 domain-containing protein [bacterium]|nr:DUF3168 domain-containing protein [bacterium]